MAVELRQWRVQDAVALQHAVNESREHLRPWMPWIEEEPLPLEAREARVRGWEEERRAGTSDYLGVWLDGALIGSCGLHRRIGVGGVEIGYWIHPAHVRRGYATEVARRLAARAFADPSVDHVEIHHDRANVASGRIPVKLGYELVAEEPQEPEAPGEEGIERVWRLTRAAHEGPPAQ